MSNNQQSNLPLNHCNDVSEYSGIRFNPVGTVIRKVNLNFQSDSEIRGIKFFDEHGNKILETKG